MMYSQLSALLMFLLLTYLLFRRPASAASKRIPTELNFQVRHSTYLTSEMLWKKTVSPSGLSGVNRSLLRGGALAVALVLPSDAGAMAQWPTDPHIRLAGAGDVSGAGKEDKREGGKASDRAKDAKDNAELL